MGCGYNLRVTNQEWHQRLSEVWVYKIYYQVYIDSQLFVCQFSLGVTMQSRCRSNMTLVKQATVTSSRFSGPPSTSLAKTSLPKTSLTKTSLAKTSLANTCLPSSTTMMSKGVLQRSHEMMSKGVLQRSHKMNTRRRRKRRLLKSYQQGPSTMLNREDDFHLHSLHAWWLTPPTLLLHDHSHSGCIHCQYSTD